MVVVMAAVLVTVTTAVTEATTATKTVSVAAVTVCVLSSHSIVMSTQRHQSVHPSVRPGLSSYRVINYVVTDCETENKK